MHSQETYIGSASEQSYSGSNGPGRTNWFDYSSILGHSSLRAVLSQKSGNFQETALDVHRKELASELGLSPARIAAPEQVHSNIVEWATPGCVHKNVDGLFTDDPQVILSLKVADCAPIFFYHPPSRLRGLVHAGWRGLAAGIIPSSVECIRTQDEDLSQVKVIIGPTIERECYEIGVEVGELFPLEVQQPDPSGRFKLDMVAAIRIQLVDAGVPDAQIIDVGICTFCDLRCHSYRRDGKRAGRMIAFFYEQP